MIEPEKLIEAWQTFRESNPYQICDGKEFRAIKEPEYCMGQMVEDTIEFLKKQMPVSPKANDRFRWYCGACGCRLHLKTKPKYCCKCGKAVKWDAGTST